MKIAIEGMDGVGKTTISKMVAEKHKFIYLEKPLKELFNSENTDGSLILSKISRKIYDFDDEIIKAWFFGLGNIYSFIEYKDQNIIIDRHFASNYFWNGTEKTKPVFNAMINLIGMPDLTIVLYASIETRMKRLHQRNPEDYDLTDKEKHVFGYDKMLVFLNEFKIPYVIINTEGKDIDEVYKEVNIEITKLKGNKNSKNLTKRLK